MAGVSLGNLLFALDRTIVTLSSAPRGLDGMITDIAMLDIDDLTLGLGRAARGAQLFLLVGIPDQQIVDWLGALGTSVPTAIMVKSPSAQVVDRAAALGIAVVAVDTFARWERTYNLITRVLDAADAAPDRAESMTSGNVGDLFELAGEVARRTNGLVSIEDERSHVLAYSAAADAADELRRLSILGREGPPEMLAWLRQWGVMDALRTTGGAVEVAAHPELGLRERVAVAIRAPGSSGELGEFLGAIWLQRGDDPIAEDAADLLVGAAAVAARVILRRRAAGTGHETVVRELLGARGTDIDAGFIGAQLGIAPDVPVAVVGFGGPGTVAPAAVSALTLHASAFSPLSVTTTIGPRVLVVLPGTVPPRAVSDTDSEGSQPQRDTPVVDKAWEAATVAWARTAVAASERQFGIRVRAVVAGPATGLAAVPMLRQQIDRVLDAATREGDLIDEVTTVAASQTGVLLGEIVALLSENPELIDRRVVELKRNDARTGSEFASSLRAYLDHFGDVRSAAESLHVHPNTLRYRIRRVQTLTGMDLDDPATRLVVALSLRVDG